MSNNTDMQTGKISPEEFATLRKRSSGRRHPFRDLVLSLEVGEHAMMTRADWNWPHTTPRTIVNQVKKSTGRSFNFYYLADNKGWAVERVG